MSNLPPEHITEYDMEHKNERKTERKVEQALSTPKKAGTPRKKSSASPTKGVKDEVTGGHSRERQRKSGPWTKEEVRALWESLSIVPSKVSWDSVSRDVGSRDKQSCRNKWRFDVMPKLQDFIDSLGE